MGQEYQEVVVGAQQVLEFASLLIGRSRQRCSTLLALTLVGVPNPSQFGLGLLAEVAQAPAFLIVA